MTHCEASS